MNTQRAIWIITSFLILDTGYMLCRFTFFKFHGMDEAADLLFIFGLIVIGLFAALDLRKIMLCTAIGYPAGFFVSLLFRQEYRDPMGTPIDNLYVWWWGLMLIAIGVGIVLEIVSRKRKKKAQARAKSRAEERTEDPS